MKASYLECKGGGSELGLNLLPILSPATNGLSLTALAKVAGLGTGSRFKSI